MSNCRGMVVVLVAVLLCSFSPSAKAISLSLSSDPLDLSSLQVGDTVDFTVNLGDLGGSELAILGGTVEFSSSVFGTPFNSAAGSIVPDASDLILSELLGLADGQFFAFNGGNITTEGDFFTFSVLAMAPGSGVIRFDPQSLFAEDGSGLLMFDFDTNELAFTVQNDEPGGTGSAVPEPATAALGLLALGGLGLTLRRRRSA